MKTTNSILTKATGSCFGKRTSSSGRALCCFLFALLTLMVLPATAQNTKKEKTDSLYLIGYVADGFTKAAIPDVLVTLLRQDSTVVDTIHVKEVHSHTRGIGRSAARSQYYFRVKREVANYIIKYEHPNYENTYMNYTQKKPSRRIGYIHIDNAYMKKATRAAYHEGGTLGEVVVKATKVKIVYKGDTIVYNADAFNVPEGSMLDRLIKQLPGVELTDEGEIFVNGKKVENLTLNGADFFKGRNQIMLQNLPYFTVKNVQVYKKQTPENKFLGIEDEDKKELTMDVVLKREYSIGGSANIEAGYGTDDRYKLKGFGMRYSDRTRAVLFGGLNNINETMEYNADRSSYNEKSQQAGDRHFRQVGGQFVYQAPEEKLTNSTEVQAQWSDDLTETRRQSETYMSDASTFGQSQGTSRSKPSSFSLNNTLRTTGSKFYTNSSLQLDYRDQRNENEGWNLTTADALGHDSINSSWYRSRSESKKLTGNVYGNLGRRFSTGDSYSIRLDGVFANTYHPLSQSLNHYRYHRLGTTDERDRRTESPSSRYSYNVRFDYNYHMTKDLNIRPFIGIGQDFSNSDRHEYLRDEADYLYDQQNSYEQRTRSLNRNAGLNMSFSKQIGTHYLGLDGTLGFNFQRQTMDYESQPLTTDITRHYTLFQPSLYIYYNTMDWKQGIILNYHMSPETPTVTDLIDRPITSDPLNIYLGNPDLKMSQRHYLEVYLRLRRDSIDQNIRLSINGSLTHNQRSQGYTYDLATGIRTYRPENIGSGNWNLSFTAGWDRALGKQKLFHIGNELILRYDKSTALALITGSTSSELSRVGNFSVHYKPDIRFQKGNLSLRLRGEVNYRNIRRNITVGKQPTDIWDFSYGLSGNYKLPWQLTIDTDLSMHSRRGYADAEQNNNRLYWDASLTKSIHHGLWVFKLRGYDLLGQVSSLRYSINAQGRTETWTNCMRRYALLTVSYRFTQKPKKK